MEHYNYYGRSHTLPAAVALICTLYTVHLNYLGMPHTLLYIDSRYLPKYTYRAHDFFLFVFVFIMTVDIRTRKGRM